MKTAEKISSAHFTPSKSVQKSADKTHIESIDGVLKEDAEGGKLAICERGGKLKEGA